MRDIVATIQPEQDDIVRSDLASTVCVQGAPGTGKTAVGLHRAAYLLYAHRDQLSRQGVLVVGPNASFLRYIADVLPALGEIDAKQTTVEELVAHVPVKAVDPVDVARLKGDARMAQVLERALWSQRRARTRRPGRADGCAPVAGPGVRGGRDRRGAAATRASGTAPGGRCCRNGSRTRSWSRWSWPATPLTTGCRTRWPAASRSRP